MTILTTALLILSWILIIAVCLPFVRNDYWIFRILEYPRYQKLVACCIVMVALVTVINHTNNFHLVTACLLGLAVIYLTVKVWPYTLVSAKEMRRVESTDKSNQVKLFSANVLQDNNEFSKMLKQIEETDPGVILLLETNKKWEKEMDQLVNKYPYYLKKPLENTYGLLFYSRYKIIEGSVNFLVENDVPSVEAVIALPSGQKVKIWGLHPKPPVPGEDSHSTAKDKELMKVALKAKQCDLPVIVMGDLNDVAWSHVTILFRKTSELLDPRIGRGFYSTFSAKNWLMRFPLDYVFCSNHFGLISMKKMPYNGSDHFPMFIHFQFTPQLKVNQPTPKASAKEETEAVEKASQ
ncbi:MAG: hypothetical protein JWQ96_2557 [Segetibacter sp.]|nr:hypothetical protein [Segetibacter sp.]